MRCVRLSVLVAASLLVPAAALGQALTPPRAVELAEAAYPPAAEEARVEGSVVLELTIDPEGTVTDAAVVEPAGHGFDEAAVEALLRSRFDPARRDGTPIPSRIRFRYVFELEDETTAPAPDAPGEEVSAGEASVGPGPGPGSEPEGAGEEAVVMDDGAGFGAVARVRRAPREAVRHTLRGEELTWVPGTANDPLRALELLPGVGRPPLNAGLLLVRGASPQESQAFYGGMPVPLLYHFGGLTSFVQPRLIEQIDFYPGNFSVRYGRKIGAAIEVVPRDPTTDRWGGEIDVDLLDASFVVEGPISDEVSVSAAARRSYVDFFFQNVVPSDLFDVVAAPVYYDYQLALLWRPSARDDVRALVYGSSDSIALVFAEPPENDPIVRGNIEVDTEFHRLHLGWTRRLSDDVEQEISFAAGPTELGFRLGDAIELDTSSVHLWTRGEWRVRASSAVRLAAGWDLLVSPYDLVYRGPPPRQLEGNTTGMGPVSADDLEDEHAQGTLFHPGLYLESAVSPVPSMDLVLGLRLDWYSDIEEWSFDPRLVVVQSLGERTRIKLGAGLFSQPPALQETVVGLGNPDLEPTQALHLGAGVAHELPEGFEVGTDAFYKYLWNRVVTNPSGEPPFSNDGVGRIYGIELYGRIPVARRVFGMLSYTLSRSERRDPDGLWRAFDYDQTHVLVAAAGWRPGAGWEIGAALRLVSGNPYTPIPEGEYDATLDLYRPIRGRVNSARNPLYNRLDLRVEKTWEFDAWRLALRLDVQNVYNARNREGQIFDYQYRGRTDLPGLPILPSLGVRGEM